MPQPSPDDVIETLLGEVSSLCELSAQLPGWISRMEQHSLLGYAASRERAHLAVEQHLRTLTGPLPEPSLTVLRTAVERLRLLDHENAALLSRARGCVRAWLPAVAAATPAGVSRRA